MLSFHHIFSTWSFQECCIFCWATTEEKTPSSPGHDRENHTETHENQKPSLDSESHNVVQKAKEDLFLTELSRYKYFCETSGCYNVYTQKQNLIQHQRIEHEGKEQLNCPYCTKTFWSTRGLDQHVSRHNGAYSSFDCERCEIRYNKRSELLAHENSAHRGRGFICLMCYRVFQMEKDLRTHQRKCC